MLNVRPKHLKEYCQGHLCGAINIPTPLPPLNKVKLRKLYTDLSKLQLKKFHPIIVYCKKGVRAGISKKMLEDLGYTNVFNLGGVITEPLKSYMKNPKYPEIHICKCS